MINISDSFEASKEPKDSKSFFKTKVLKVYLFFLKMA